MSCVYGTHVACSSSIPPILYCGTMDAMELESSPSGSDSEGESPIMTTVQSGKPFSKEVAAVLEALYSRVMTRWGKKHSGDIETATANTSLQLTQVKLG